MPALDYTAMAGNLMSAAGNPAGRRASPQVGAQVGRSAPGLDQSGNPAANPWQGAAPALGPAAAFGSILARAQQAPPTNAPGPTGGGPATLPPPPALAAGPPAAQTLPVDPMQPVGPSTAPGVPVLPQEGGSMGDMFRQVMSALSPPADGGIAGTGVPTPGSPVPPIQPTNNFDAQVSRYQQASSPAFGRTA